MNNASNPTGTGYLQIRVFTAGGAFPVEGAQVYVTGDGTDGTDTGLIASLVTDRAGLTRRISLPAPPSGLSMSPDNLKPYRTYNVETKKEGFRTVDDMNVPVFDGVTSIQPVEMVPESEGFGITGISPEGGNITVEETTGEGLK